MYRTLPTYGPALVSFYEYERSDKISLRAPNQAQLRNGDDMSSFSCNDVYMREAVSLDNSQLQLSTLTTMGISYSTAKWLVCPKRFVALK